MQLADPSPDPRQQGLIWEYFGSRCAYCDRAISKTLKEGHIDHLVSAALGGRNHMANRVLACATCNETEKRDAPWEDFLAAKATDPATLDMRRARIEEWTRLHASADTPASAALRELAVSAADAVNRLFDEQVATIRAAKPRRRDTAARAQAPVIARSSDHSEVPRVRYAFTRLCFKADLIEPLSAEDKFRVDTPEGSFQMTKGDFYIVFESVVASESYQVRRLYHYTKVPEKALQFLLPERRLSNER